MFLDLEQQLHSLLDGAIEGVTVAAGTVVGTLDPLPDMTQPGAPSVLLRTEWGGSVFGARTPDAVQVSLPITVALYVAGVRVRPQRRADVIAGIETIIARLLGWRPAGEDSEPPEFAAGDAPGEFAGVWRWSVTLNPQKIRLRAATPQE